MPPITFDRAARAVLLFLLLSALLAVGWLLRSVLIPFLAAGVLAYILNPVVDFFQHTCRLRLRVVCVVLTMVLFFGVIALLLWLCVPPIVAECMQVERVAQTYLSGEKQLPVLGEALNAYLQHALRPSQVLNMLQGGDFPAVLREVLPRLWALISSAADLLWNFAASLIALLYLFFLMLDYERYARAWTDFVPPHHRPAAQRLAVDFTHYFCGYFRGQLFIALSNCVLFTAGFLITGFPTPIALGCFIGIISFVPYLQIAGIVPATVLALLRASTTGDSFWMLMAALAAVYVVVQIIQDTLVTPRIMGRIMGLSPAIILLALSVGGFAGGIVGLIVALPVTTLAMVYYKRLVVCAG